MAEILVIDDEPIVRSILGRVLERHTVTFAGGGGEGIAALDVSDYDVVLCDLMMPDVSGKAVYEWAAQNRPALLDRWVFVTGGAVGVELEIFLERVPSPKLSKPFELSELMAVIDGASGSGRRALGVRP
jgi:CheY-like chemotaxis protein